MNPDPNQAERNDKGGAKKPPRPQRTTFVLLMIGGIIILLLTAFGQNGGGLLGEREKEYVEFLEALYTGRVSKLEVVGDREAHWEKGGAQGSEVFRTALPSWDLEKIQENFHLVGRAPRDIGQDEFLARLETKSLDPISAWTVMVGRDLKLFVEAEDRNEEARVLYEVKRGLSGSVAMGEIREGLKPFEITVQSKDLPGGRESLSYREPNTFWPALLGTTLPWIVLIAFFWFFVIRQMRSGGGAGGILSFGRAKPNLVNKEKVVATFQDVAGVEEAKQEVKEIVEFLRNPSRFSRLGGRIPRGVLLVGPPGTGKTLLAKAIAGEAKVPFFSISGSDFVEMFVGVGASRVRDLFRQARENSPCLIFLDEIDAVGRKRGSGMGGGHDEREQTLNAILVEMDGFQTDEGIILMAATNRSDVLDPALLRPGRFDRQIMIHLPDLKGRRAILDVHTKKIKMDPRVDLGVIARGTPTFSGAELAALVNEGALIATLKDKDAVEISDLEEARDKVRWGRQKTSQVMDEEDRRITAYHEAGHALIALLHDEVEPLHKVTIIPRGMSLGATMVLPERDRYHQRRKQVMGLITFAYGGRIAEELFCDDISAGAYDDIRRATEMARTMVCQWGMSDKLGPIAYSDQDEHLFLGQELVRSKNHSEETSIEIDKEVSRILRDCYADARKMIEEQQDKLQLITDALMRYETLSGRQVYAVVDGVPIDQLETIAQEPADPVSPEPDRSATERRSPRVEPDLRGDLPPAGEPAF